MDVSAVVEDYKAQRDTLGKYLRFLISFRRSLAEGSKATIARIEKLEIADLLPLQVAQLQTEGGLGSYLNWLACAYLHAHIDGNTTLAQATRALPVTPIDALAGHLGPSNEIPESFLTAMVRMPGEARLLLGESKDLSLQFGDVFLVENQSEGSKPEARLVISQTCDIVQCKIGEKVLCVDGEVKKLKGEPHDLFAATLAQVLEASIILVKDGSDLLQINWNDKNASTIPMSELQSQKGYKYLGRLNEIYALNIQHIFLFNIGRIGVPVRPMRLVCYTKAEIKLVDAGDTSKQAHATMEKSVVGVASMKRDGGVHLTYLPDLVRWAAGFVKESIDKYPAQDAFRKKLEKAYATMVADPRNAYSMRRSKKDTDAMRWLSYFNVAATKFEEVELKDVALTVHAAAKISEVPVDAPKQRIELRLDMPIEIDDHQAGGQDQ